MAKRTKTDEWRDCFFGRIKVPARTSTDHAEALAQIAWKEGIYEDAFLSSFRKWFRAFAERRPDLATVKVFDVYPVDEFRWVGPYESSRSESSESEERENHG
jgi:hypothetical protein